MKALVALCFVLSFPAILAPQIKERSTHPVSLSAQMKNGAPLYRLNGKVVEDRVQNSLLNNLTRILAAHGSETPVFVVVDVRAPFSEFGKLERSGQGCPAAPHILCHQFQRRDDE